MRENFISQIDVAEWCLLPSQTDDYNQERDLVCVSGALVWFSLKGPQDTP